MLRIDIAALSAAIFKERTMPKTAKQIENLHLAIAKWKLVDPKDVSDLLGTWRCGTQACFGGHVATWPEFQAQGVTARESDGCPMMVGTQWESYTSLAFKLFGDSYLFSHREFHAADHMPWAREVTDHEIVLQRLNWVLEQGQFYD